ncbi:aspartate 4-decarboxylase [Romboutsia sp. 1001216sp1]|uniref:aspartate 4-decarboxylase n=1 Tax=unclassified Romboutsia TaxID=2626894 RepID=UPI0018AC5B8B|nr:MULTISPECIES: aspartate 4-decarboxylase [unclassified Romboutsia]MDB8793445.1 aspartate 4-decarboxylase [Romboutsia sp. 1001216sp1]MDB8796987.1 aspartate 4-decarboxylase [Romboutsia sp. 1001216sp1]MDB8799733.1 aspartate 4-decarboxylase [Romboutsia sp. 1001216sp1]
MEPINIKRQELENIYGKISPFEFKNKLLELATNPSKKSTRTLLDAGRGNPNWIAHAPRNAFFTFGHFAIEESKHTWNNGPLSGMPRKKDISKRFFTYLDNNSNLPEVDFLRKMVEFCVYELGFNSDDFLHEITDAIIGDNYPFPDRMLIHIEKIVKAYLTKELKYDTLKGGDFDIFAVEGATAAMCYVFDSLIANNLLLKGDKIAIMTPVFTPYLEIPHLPRYEFDVVYINADEKTPDGKHTWQCTDKELEKLCDKDIKALFVVNPSNPPSMAISPESTSKIVNIVKNHNPNLMIISDDVYGTFVHGFKSLMSELPYNTIGAYSYSKYFGVTGWRLGTLALHHNNVFDKLINELPYSIRKRTNKRYADMNTNPEKVPFIDRLVADSRQVALNHTAGLSTPQQVQMAFLSLVSLMDNNDSYKNLTIDICRTRKKLLFDSLGMDLEFDKNDASYYTQFDVLDLAKDYYGEDFSYYLEINYNPVDILFDLAEESSIVLLGGGGFAGPKWSIRISLANLFDDAYSEIGHSLKKVLDNYFNEYKKA